MCHAPQKRPVQITLLTESRELGSELRLLRGKLCAIT